MKNFKVFGSLLTKEQQKKISGGESQFTNVLMCNYVVSGTYYPQPFSYSSYEDCVTNGRIPLCSLGGEPSYVQCYCTPDEAPGLHCGS